MVESLGLVSDFMPGWLEAERVLMMKVVVTGS